MLELDLSDLVALNVKVIHNECLSMYSIGIIFIMGSLTLILLYISFANRS